jgi:hypothetical protein
MIRCSHRVAFGPFEPGMVQEVLRSPKDKAYAARGISMGQDCKSRSQL